MELTGREIWGAVHGMVFGGAYLLLFAGGLAGLLTLSPGVASLNNFRIHLRWLRGVIVAMAVMVWLTVLTGTYVVYPWYRAKEATSPRSQLLADPLTAQWHRFGMEWKEHVAWIAPLLATLVAFIVIYYGPRLASDSRLRKIAIALFVLAFLVVGVAGLLGALITKKAPVL